MMTTLDEVLLTLVDVGLEADPVPLWDYGPSNIPNTQQQNPR
jgi:hypothetical protein